MSLRLVRSPDAPKTTITQGSPGRPALLAPFPDAAIPSASCIFRLSGCQRLPRAGTTIDAARNNSSRLCVYFLPTLAAGRALHVPAVFVAHTRQQLFRNSVILPRTEASVQQR